MRLGLKKTGGKFPAEVREHFSTHTVTQQHLEGVDGESSCLLTWTKVAGRAKPSC